MKLLSTTVAVLATLAVVSAQVSTEVQTEYGALCVGETDGAFVNDPRSCPAYFQCVGDEIYKEGRCGEHLQFHEKERHCSYAIGECAEYWLTETTPVPTTTIPTTTLPPSPVECIAGDIHNVAHPKICNEYYVCYNGKAFPETCAEGLEFDPVSGECIFVKDSQCVTNPCPEVDPETPQRFPDTKNCRAYFLCLNGEPQSFTCAEGTSFDEAAQKCIIGDDCYTETGTVSYF